MRSLVAPVLALPARCDGREERGRAMIVRLPPTGGATFARAGKRQGR